MAEHFFLEPKSGPFVLLPTTANTTRDLTAGSNVLLATMPITGGYFSGVSLMPLGTNVGCVIRFFLNNGSATTTATNNMLLDEIQINATTGGEAAQLLAIPKVLPPIWCEGNWRLYATRSAFSAGNAGFSAIAQMMVK